MKLINFNNKKQGKKKEKSWESRKGSLQKKKVNEKNLES